METSGAEEVAQIPYPEKTSITLSQAWESFKTKESEPPDPDEPIHFGKLKIDSADYQLLTSLGINPSEFESGSLTRSRLLQVGIVFKNTIGGGEKPLINAVIDNVDFGKRKLLTRLELEKIMAYQSRHPEQFGTKGLDLETIRKDMFSFLLTGPDPRPMGFQFGPTVFRNAMYSMTRLEYAYMARDLPPHLKYLYPEIVKGWYKETEKSHEKDVPHFNPADLQGDLLRRYFQKEFPWEDHPDFLTQSARGHTIRIIQGRYGAISEEPSPFLDSGFHFGPNPDITFKARSGETMRINMVNLHLASRGLSEMGGTLNTSYDQRYATIGEYADEIFPTQEDLQRVREQEESMFVKNQDFNTLTILWVIQDRMIDLALDWAKKMPSKSKYRRLAEKIEKLRNNPPKPVGTILRETILSFLRKMS